ncbi:SGNH/GDSL hydrolase family protein [Ensifer sp. R-19]|uniref:SGNH/GDSL hydrolase family protein n=1 Tax=Ensifer sp. R-19 TaxID=3404055 RepID=UPI003CF43054
MLRRYLEATLLVVSAFFTVSLVEGARGSKALEMLKTVTVREPDVLGSATVELQRPEAVSARDVRSLQFGWKQPLSFQFVTDAIVTENATGERLVEGKDYQIDYDAGWIKGLRENEPVDVTVAYVGEKSRYDAIYRDPATGKVDVASGAERGADVTEYKPTIPAGTIHLMDVFVTRSNGFDVIPAKTVLEPDWVAESRRRLPHLLRKLRAGEAITLVGYGDSITSQGGPAPIDWYRPDGELRDVLEGYIYNGRFQADTVAAIPLFDHGDGAGPIHTHIGWNWHFKRAMEEAYRVAVAYRNLGIGGTTSRPTLVNSLPGALYPQRLEALKSLEPDVVVISVGMNELGDASLETNVRELVRLVRSFGAEPIVMGIPVIPGTDPDLRFDAWIKSNRDLAQAAKKESAAFVPILDLVTPAGKSVFGFAIRSSASTNGINHPGPAELKVYGELLSEIVSVD